MPEKEKHRMVMCVIERDGKFLLPLKSRKIGVGRRNGVGGKIEEGESPEQAARRETKEETGIEISQLRGAGYLDVSMPNMDAELYIFHVTGFAGEPTEQEDQGITDFQWFDKDKLPFNMMWPTDAVWYPLFLEGSYFKGHAELDEKGNIISHDIHPEQNKESGVR